MANLFIDVNGKSDNEKFPCLIGRFDFCDAGHTQGDMEHLQSLIEMSIEDGDISIEDGEKEIEVASRKVKAVDTVGAGDMFAGVFLHGITNGVSMKESAKRACDAASEIVSIYGARMDRLKLKKIVEM